MMINKNPVTRAIYDNVVRPAMDIRHPPASGVISSYNPQTGRANVTVSDPIGASIRELENIPVLLTKGFANYDLEVGDRVMVEYHGADPSDPFVSFIYDEDFETNTREERKAPKEYPKGIRRSQADMVQGESAEAKQYLENGRIGVIHPIHRSTFRIDGESGDAEILAAYHGTPSPVRIRARSDGQIEILAPRIENIANRIDLQVEPNELYYNEYPLNYEMALKSETHQCLMMEASQILALKELLKLVSNLVPGGELIDIDIEGVAPYGTGTVSEEEEWLGDMRRIIEKYLSN